MGDIVKVIMVILKYLGKLNIEIEEMADGKWRICFTIDPKELIQ